MSAKLAKPKKPSKSDKDYEQLGRMLANIYETGYMDRNQAYRQSFIKGVLSGFGGVLGATILVGILLWILSLLNNVPFVDRFVNNIRSTVQSQSK